MNAVYGKTKNRGLFDPSQLHGSRTLANPIGFADILETTHLLKTPAVYKKGQLTLYENEYEDENEDEDVEKEGSKNFPS